MKLKKDGHITTFRLGDKELKVPDRAWIRFIESLKREIPSEFRFYHPEDKTWCIDIEYEPVLDKLINKYFKE